MSRMPNVEEIYKGMPLLGHTVSWLLRGVEISHDDVATLLKVHGFGATTPQRPPPTKRAVRRAIRDWIVWRLGRTVADDENEDDVLSRVRVTAKRGRGARSNQLIRTVGDDAKSKWLVFSLIDENPDVKELALDYTTSVRFFLNKKDERLAVTTTARGQLAAENEATRIASEIAPFWERHKGLYLSGDISRVLTAMMAAVGAVAVREGGGTYFVPSAHQERLEQIKTFVGTLPTATGRPAILMTFPLLDAAAVREQVRQAAEDDFAAELDQCDKDLQRFEEKKSGAVREGTISARISDYLRMRQKAKLYADTTGMRQERILDSIAALETRARALEGITESVRAERAGTSDIDFHALGIADGGDRFERTA